MKKKLCVILTILLCSTLFLMACGQSEPELNEIETPTSDYPNYYGPANYPYDEIDDPSLSEQDPSNNEDDPGAHFEINHEGGSEQLALYYDFFANNFEITPYESMHGEWQLWGHNTQGEQRLMKQAHFNIIEGFDYPVLVLVEYLLCGEGINIIEMGFYNAYIIRSGRIDSNLTSQEFHAIFTEVGDYDMGWFTRYNGDFLEVEINGDSLFSVDFSGDVRTDGSMDQLLAWLRGN